MTTALAYLISLNLPDLLYSPANIPELFDPEQQKSTNELDSYIMKNLERVLRSCDLTQASQLRLTSNPKLASLT